MEIVGYACVEKNGMIMVCASTKKGANKHGVNPVYPPFAISLDDSGVHYQDLLARFSYRDYKWPGLTLGDGYYTNSWPDGMEVFDALKEMLKKEPRAVSRPRISITSPYGYSRDITARIGKYWLTLVDHRNGTYGVGWFMDKRPGCVRHDDPIPGHICASLVDAILAEIEKPA